MLRSFQRRLLQLLTYLYTAICIQITRTSRLCPTAFTSVTQQNLEDPFQSACPAHSVETAIVCIQDNVLRSLDVHRHVVLVLLDLSAAFDTIDHDILLRDLDRIVVRRNAFCWFASHLTDRTQCANGHSSCRTQLRHGVSQVSVFGPLLFTVYCAGLSDVFAKHDVRYHVYADDAQLGVDFPLNDSASAADRISHCVMEVKV